ncbi:MAG: hypothetical protein H6817_06680 [Phycisphaerales bacterium]|nr:hypothetical protein [Phycisphaerales bacterium]
MRVYLHLIFAVGLLSAAGCSTFNDDWEAYTSQSRSGAAPVGRWQGTWTSATTGHTGPLRCIVSPMTNECVSARFRAVYAGFIPYERTITLCGADRGGLWRFEGEEDLGGLAGGVYRFDGEASWERFFTRYTAAADRGEFELTRYEFIDTPPSPN